LLAGCFLGFGLVLCFLWVCCLPVGWFGLCAVFVLGLQGVSGCWAWLSQASCSRCLRGRGSVFSVYPVLYTWPWLGRIQRALFLRATGHLRRRGVMLAGRVYNSLVLFENSHYPAEQRAFTTRACHGACFINPSQVRHRRGRVWARSVA